ncbi:hypothetical protein [Roseicyclus sp.]|uniref:hypothetical protein n=1 Tax=Roseicyclus sp. TaxID=1914329 RepID=UPI001BCB872B|nr:hypothetical protein [Roseicyclus sp.]MDA0923934.1 hypothetical protein [Pseudomonadota bacterium]
MTELPEYYFRVRETGAVVFHISTNNKHRRIEMDEIATVNIRNGNIRPHGERVLNADETSIITEWIAARRAVLAERDIDDIHRAVDYLNLTTQWAQSRATAADLEEVTDRLLLAMHDLRSVLVRKKTERIMNDDATPMIEESQA